MGEEADPALGTEVGIKQLQCPRTCVPRVGEGVLSTFLLLGLQPGEVRIGDVGFATDFNHIRPWSLGQFQRYAPNRAGVVGDVVSLDSVAAGQALDQNAVLVDQRQGHSVDLVFDGVFERFVLFEQLEDASIELVQFLVREGVFDREHRHPVRDCLEPFDRFATDLVCRAVGAVVFGMSLFERLQFAHHPVVLDVGCPGGRFDVVQPVELSNRLAERLNLLLDGLAHSRPWSRRPALACRPGRRPWQRTPR